MTVPAWAVDVPSAPVRGELAVPFTFPFTPQQLFEYGVDLIEQFLRRVVNAVAGIFIPGVDAFTQLQTWAQGISSAIEGAVDWVLSLVDALLDALGIPKVGQLASRIADLASGVGNWFTDFGALVLNLLTNPAAVIGNIAQVVIDGANNTLQALLGGLTQAWTGLTGLVTVPDVIGAAASISDTLAANSAALSALTTDVSILFGDPPPDLPDSLTVMFDLFGSGGLTAGFGIPVGQPYATFVDLVIPGSEGTYYSDAHIIYNDEATASDYQRVGTIWFSGPALFDDGPPVPVTRILGRANSGVTSFVEAEFTKTQASLIAVVDGTPTVLDSVAHDFQANSIYWLICGTPGNQREFRILLGSTPILAYTDSGEISELGAGFRYTGAGSRIVVTVPPVGDAHVYTGGRLYQFAFADNAP